MKHKMNYKHGNSHQIGKHIFLEIIYSLNYFFFLSKTGKMLMARCKKLLEENEQLGKLVSSDNVAKLEGEIALQNRLVSNIKDSQKGK